MLLLKKKELVFFGGGDLCEKCMKVSKYPVKFIFDNHKDSGYVQGIPIIKFSKAVSFDNIVIVVTLRDEETVCKQLQDRGLTQNLDYIEWYKMYPQVHEKEIGELMPNEYWQMR